MGTKATRADRRFGASELSQLDRAAVRMLCHGLMLADGATVETYRQGPDYDDLVVGQFLLWRWTRTTVRILYRPTLQVDLSEAGRAARSTGTGEGVLISTHPEAGPLSPEVGVHHVSATELAARITRSAFVSWDADGPRVATERLRLHVELVESTALTDVMGITWLPSLALNELPPDLAELDEDPETLFERKAFQLLTAACRFGGTRYGEAARGKRLPDATLILPQSDGVAALLDCKARSSGFRMESDDLLRFVGYWSTLEKELVDVGHPIEYFIVVSSFFQGESGDRHPFHSRSEEMREKTGTQLAYVCAADLAWFVARIEELGLQPEQRQSIGWKRLLDHGLVDRSHFDDALRAVI